MSLYSKAIADNASYIFTLDDGSPTMRLLDGTTVNSSIDTSTGTLSVVNASVTGTSASITSASGYNRFKFIEPGDSSITGGDLTFEMVGRFRSIGDASKFFRYEKTTTNSTVIKRVTVDGQGGAAFRFATGKEDSANTTVGYAAGEWFHIIGTFGVGGDGNPYIYWNNTRIDSSNTVFSADSGDYGAASPEAARTHYITIPSNLDVDFFAVYSSSAGGSLTSTKRTDHYNEFLAGVAAYANRTMAAPALTASALMVNPAVSAQKVVNYSATVMTASASLPDPAWSEFDIVSTLDGYMSSLDLELYLKFNDPKVVHNSGTAPDQIWSINGTLSVSGPNGTYALDAGGTPNATLVTPPGISDGDFSMGIWVKFDETMTDDLQRIMFVPQTYIGDSNGTLIGTQNKHPYFKFDTDVDPHEFEATTITLEDGEWHYLAMRFDGTDLYYYVDGEEVASGAISGTPTFGYNLWLSNFPWEGQQSYEILSSPYIAEFSSVTETEIAGIYAAGTSSAIQGQATIVEPVTKFNNAYNDFVENSGAIFDVRFDEAGFLKNWGTYQNPAGIQDYISTGTVKQVSTKNRYGYEFLTAYDTWINQYTDLTNLGSSSTHSIYAKFVTTGEGIDSLNFPYLSGLGGGEYGNGEGSVAIGYDNSGPIFAVLEGESYNFYDPSTWNGYATNDDSFMDSWHLYTVTLDGAGYAHCYIDGKLITSIAVTSTHPTTGSIVINAKSWYGDYNELNNFYIDEMQMWDTAGSAQDIFDLWQSLTIDQDWVASAELPTPVGISGSGVNYHNGLLTASAAFPNPLHSHGSNLSNGWMTAFGTFANPNFAAYKNVNFAQDSLTASALFEHPTLQVGEFNGAEHMDAFAEMPEAYARIPGKWNASPWIANPAVMVMPAISTTQGALIKAQTFYAKSVMVTPPAYYLLTDDIWFSRLYAQHKANTTEQKSFLKFFNEGTNILLGAEVESQAFGDGTGTVIGTNTQITPSITAGYTDIFNRKAVLFKNIGINFAPQNASGDTYAITDRGYSLEMMFKTSKATQVLFSGSWQSASGPQGKNSQIGLYNGKLYTMESFRPLTGSMPEMSPKTYDQLNALKLEPKIIQATKTNVADGEWHHILIQMGFDGRIQMWIDKKLELQKYTGNFAYPWIIGYNSADSTLSSDFFMSVVSVNTQQFLSLQDADLNYYAAIGYEPIKATPLTASADITQNTTARGNRGRALMLYFWDTATPTQYSGYKRRPGGLDISNTRYTNFDQYSGGEFDYDTFFPFPTWANNGEYLGATKYADWDVFAVDVQGFTPSAVVKRESYSNVRQITNFGDVKTNYLVSDGFKDELDNRRYLDLMNDIDISQFDMICFRNYPDQESERLAYSTLEEVDEYFNIRENVIFDKFLQSLRDAIDTGISLFVSNYGLAMDLGIIDGWEAVPQMDEIEQNPESSDPYTRSLFLTPRPVRTDENAIYSKLHYHDTNKNNFHRVVTTIPGLTDDPSYIWKNSAFWESDDAILGFGSFSRNYEHYEYKENGLQVGDEFMWYTVGNLGSEGYFDYYTKNMIGVPFDHIKAGKVVTAFAQNVRKGMDLVPNDYRNWATTIAVEPGDMLNGKQVGGKIFVSLTERLSFSDDITKPRSYSHVELKTDYWINKAYDDGAITLTERNKYLTTSLDRDLESGKITQSQYNEQLYWQVHGDNLLGALSEYGDVQVDLYSALDSVLSPGKNKSSKVRRNFKSSTKVPSSITYSSGLPNFQLQTSWKYPMGVIYTPNINDRGWLWLSDRSEYDALPQRPAVATATATMPNPVVTGFKEASVNVQAMIATATITETSNNSGNIRIAVLPMTARAEFTQRPFVVPALPMNAIASFRPNTTILARAVDEVVLYVKHQDPVLYIREDIIK